MSDFEKMLEELKKDVEGERTGLQTYKIGVQFLGAITHDIFEITKITLSENKYSKHGVNVEYEMYCLTENKTYYVSDAWLKMMLKNKGFIELEREG